MDKSNPSVKRIALRLFGVFIMMYGLMLGISWLFGNQGGMGAFFCWLVAGFTVVHREQRRSHYFESTTLRNRLILWSTLGLAIFYVLIFIISGRISAPFSSDRIIAWTVAIFVSVCFFNLALMVILKWYAAWLKQHDGDLKRRFLNLLKTGRFST